MWSTSPPWRPCSLEPIRQIFSWHISCCAVTVGSNEIPRTGIAYEQVALPEPVVRRKRNRMSRILVVDDEPTIVELIEESLHIEGYDTSRAYSGEEALDLLAKDPPDLVLLDLMLPGMDG